MIIYKATNKINGKCYIGQTRHSLEHRKAIHIRCAKRGVETHFYQAIRKYGAENFEWSIICSTNNKQHLNELETFYITKYDSIKRGYNMVDGGDNNVMDIESVKTKHDEVMRSEEVRNKISKSMKQYRKEHPFTVEHRRRISESLSGKKFDADRRKLCDTGSIGCYCITENGDELHFHSYRDAWKWWSSVDNPFNSKAECVYQRKIKQSIDTGYYTYNRNGIKYEYPKWFREVGGANVKKVTNS